MTTVVDASAVIDLLLGQLSEPGLGAFDAELVAPELLPIEVTAAVAKLCRRNAIDLRDAQVLLDAFEELSIELLTVRHLMTEVLALSDRLSVYDACYVALAASEGAVVVTTDGRLGRAHDLPVDVIVL